MAKCIKFCFTIIIICSSFVITNAQQNFCDLISVPRDNFNVRTDFARVNTKWYPEWLEMHNGQMVYPDAMLPLQKFEHPWFNSKYPNSMHEDSHSSDVSNYSGPVPEGIGVQYFRIVGLPLEKNSRRPPMGG